MAESNNGRALLPMHGKSMRGDGCGAMDPTCRLSPQPRMGGSFSSRRGEARSSSASGCGCDNVVLGCGLIIGVLLALAIVIVVFVNAFI